MRGGYCIRSRQQPVVTPEEEEGPDVGVYAGLGRRFIAFIVDAILILPYRDCRNHILFPDKRVKICILSRWSSGPRSMTLTEAGTADAAFGPIIAALGMLIIIIPWLYYAGFESSRSQATPGKVLMRIMVTDIEGNKPTFARATLRHFAKFISALIIFIGFLDDRAYQETSGAP
ncbi:MAG: RDD family protein [Rhodopseudomonas palustris]|nr:RDD family protein [Rhodopseudomonas palustris]